MNKRTGVSRDSHETSKYVNFTIAFGAVGADGVIVSNTLE